MISTSSFDSHEQAETRRLQGGGRGMAVMMMHGNQEISKSATKKSESRRPFVLFIPVCLHPVEVSSRSVHLIAPLVVGATEAPSVPALKNFKFSSEVRGSPEVLSMQPCTLKLDEEKSKYASLA